jgi:citrate lyase beta subunit
MSTTNMLVNPRRCLLFVPGTRPERFEKALATDVDQVCIDLEDAVALADKETAREATFAFIKQGHSTRCELGFRINAISTDQGKRDLAVMVASQVCPAFVMLPKVESADDIHVALQILGGVQVPLIAQLESPRAVFESRAIAKVTSMLQALMFGGFDYAVAARVKPGKAGWAWARSMIAAAAAEAEVGAIDVPSLEIKDATIVSDETDEVIAMGYTAKAAIHPAQVAAIQSAYLPTNVEVANAQKIVSAIAAANGAAIAVDGKLVDRPIELAAQRILELARLGVRDTLQSLANIV